MIYGNVATRCRQCGGTYAGSQMSDVHDGSGEHVCRRCNPVSWMIERIHNALHGITDQAIHFANTKLWAWMGIGKWAIVEQMNKVLQPFGLRLTMRSYYDDLLRTRYEHFFMANRIEQLEEELEELQPVEESEVQA